MNQVAGFRFQVSVNAVRSGLDSLRHMLLYVLCPVALSLSGCAGKPPPDWKINAQAALESHARHHLNGDNRLADMNFAKAKDELSRTGRPDLMARAELFRCAVHSAALEWDDCPAYQAYAEQAAPEDRAYADFLAGTWDSLAADSLPETYRAVVKAPNPEPRTAALAAIQDPRSRLIAASILFRQARIQPAEIAVAVDTASAQGWRRPLLAWLNVQARRAEAAGDAEALRLIKGRIDVLIGQTPASSAIP